MKVFNEIPAEVSGQIVAVLVENGEPVEFGQPLFKVDPQQIALTARRAARDMRSIASAARRLTSTMHSMYKTNPGCQSRRNCAADHPRLPRAGHRDGRHLQRGRSRRRVPGLADEAYCVGPAKGGRQLPARSTA